jgi:hypothetical protein
MRSIEARGKRKENRIWKIEYRGKKQEERNLLKIRVRLIEKTVYKIKNKKKSAITRQNPCHPRAILQHNPIKTLRLRDFARANKQKNFANLA